QGCFDVGSAVIEPSLFDEEYKCFELVARDKCDSVISDKAKKMLSEEEEGYVIVGASILIGDGDDEFALGLQVFTSIIHGICDERTENPTEQSLEELTDLSESGSLNTTNVKLRCSSTAIALLKR
ncbi:unnamed protein product, partial [Adineta ricciae]